MQRIHLRVQGPGFKVQEKFPCPLNPLAVCIAEGYERDSNKETANFLNYAKGSAGELRTQIYIGYIDKETGKAWLTEAETISKMLHGLIHSVRSRPS